MLLLPLLFTTLVFALFGVAFFPTYRWAYEEHAEALRKEAWLYAQCQDAAFEANMQRRASTRHLCAAARDLFARSAFDAGMEACYDAGVEQWGLTLLLLMVLSVPMHRLWRDHYERKRLTRISLLYSKEA